MTRTRWDAVLPGPVEEMRPRPADGVSLNPSTDVSRVERRQAGHSALPPYSELGSKQFDRAAVLSQAIHVAIGQGLVSRVTPRPVATRQRIGADLVYVVTTGCAGPDDSLHGFDAIDVGDWLLVGSADAVNAGHRVTLKVRGCLGSGGD